MRDECGMTRSGRRGTDFSPVPRTAARAENEGPQCNHDQPPKPRELLLGRTGPRELVHRGGTFLVLTPAGLLAAGALFDGGAGSARGGYFTTGGHPKRNAGSSTSPRSGTRAPMRTNATRRPKASAPPPGALPGPPP